MKNDKKIKLYPLTIAIAMASLTFVNAESEPQSQECENNCQVAFDQMQKKLVEENRYDELAQESNKLETCLKECNKSLLQAAKENNAEGVIRALKRGGLIEELDSENKSALTHAFLHKNSQMIEALLNADATCNTTKAFIKDIVTNFLGEEGDSDGNCINTALHQNVVTKFTQACLSEDKNKIQEISNFLVGGADVVTSEGAKAIFDAIEENKKDMVKYLLCKKLNPNIVKPSDSANTTPLHFACEKGNLEIVQILVQNGASIQATTTDGLTPLHIALNNLNLNLIKYLVEDKTNAEGNVIPGANTMVKTGNGKFPIQLAKEANVSELLENNSDIILDQETIIEFILENMTRDAVRNAKAKIASEQQSS